MRLRSAMLPDEHDTEPPYAGPYCVLRREEPFYTVAIEPPMPCGDGALQTYASKIGAWDQMLAWVSTYRLPVLNLLDPKVVDHREE